MNFNNEWDIPGAPGNRVGYWVDHQEPMSTSLEDQFLAVAATAGYTVSIPSKPPPPLQCKDLATHNELTTYLYHSEYGLAWDCLASLLQEQEGNTVAWEGMARLANLMDDTERYKMARQHTV